MSNQEIDPKLVFKNLEKILNMINSKVLILGEPIKILILVRTGYEQAEGLIRISKKVLPIKVEFHTNSFGDSLLAVEIGNIYYTLEGEELTAILSKLKEGEQ